MSEFPIVAIFRPKNHLKKSVEILEGLGFEVMAKPLLIPVSTGQSPLTEADFIIFTSSTGVDFALGSLDKRKLEDVKVCAIGPKTAGALKDEGVTVELIPEEFSSTGLVKTLSPLVSGRKVEIARSTEGSELMIRGLNDTGAFVHETQLYRLDLPKTKDGELEKILRYADTFLFTSSLMVRHLLELVDSKERCIEVLDENIVGAIGGPTEETLLEYDISVDLMPHEASFSALANKVRGEFDRYN